MLSPLYEERGMLIGRRNLVTGLAASCAMAMFTRPARAGVMLPLTMSELVHNSVFALVGVARESTAEWENDERGKRIVTYTRVETEHVLDGRKSPSGDLYVRTLGGDVGEIGQLVHGEAQLEPNKPGVFFLRDSIPGTYSVTGMAQGHYRLRADKRGIHRLLPGRNLAELLDETPDAAVTRLRDKSVADCELLIAEELRPR